MPAVENTLSQPQSHYRACHLCEAICGLKIVTEGEQIRSITGDKDDPLSRGHICPKGVALKELHGDPDRLRTPIQKVAGQWQPIAWQDAYQLVADKLSAIQRQYGDDAIGIYAGNPNVHNLGHMTHGSHFTRLIKTKNRFSATSVDQLPHHLVSLWMYGHQFLLPIADIDHTDLLLVIGANPLASNGSLLTAPDIRNRLSAIRDRGGEVVVIDPRRTETAKRASAHHFIRPGTDAALLLAMIKLIVDNRWQRPNHLTPLTDGLEQLSQAVAPFSVDWVSAYCGIEAATIERLTKRLCQANSAAVYGRMGVSTQAFGTLCQWAIQVLNLLTGNLDSVGGTLVSTPAINPAGPSDRAKGHFGRWHSRVRGLAEFSKELPCAVMAEEITTAGAGQIKAMITIAGNPVLSTPSADNLDKALASLDFMVSVDPYLNETTRHADLILPPASPLAHSHYDLIFNKFAVRNYAKYSKPVFARAADERLDHEIFNGLALALAAANGMPLQPLPAPEAMLALGLADGPYANSDNPLTPEQLLSAEHGIDLGPLTPSLPARLCTDNGRINAFPAPIATDIARLQQQMDRPTSSELTLIGKRDLRSNNSWMHNLPYLVKGKPRCVLLVHPNTLTKLHLSDGETAQLSANGNQLTVTIAASDDVHPEVVCLPHGWGHRFADTQQQVANEHPGVNFNRLADAKQLDPLSGNAVLSGFTVQLKPLDKTDKPL
ncbi:molybdopterin-dependent oxidoreductase [Ferrimonas senticii]|uniref:molybdopterin-dependent oxidoreductase n=1 Tax=Ferrimonas senticii TaxID=394566 RepID=UPI0004161D71|nr:molybdopterin-dependent oxidoreductase [Ferrimonas senticii]